MRVEVRGQANETRHTATYEVSPNGKPWTVYEQPTAADESVRIVVTARGMTERLTADTTASDCWGPVHAHVTANGDLRLFADHC